MADERRIAQDVLKALGGDPNVVSVNYCMTRLRVEPKGMAAVDVQALKRCEGVKGAIQTGNLVQVILGPGLAEKVARELSSRLGIAVGESTGSAAPAAASRGGVREVLRKLANVFLPLLPAIIGSGMIAALTNLLVRMGVDAKLPVMQALSVIGWAVFGYLSIMVGMNAAKEYGGPPALGAVAGSILIAPALTGLKMVPGRGGLIGVLIAAAFLSWLYKRVSRVMPDTVTVIATPTITILVGGLVILYVVQPIGGFLSDGITKGTQALLNVGGPVAGAVLAGAFLPAVMTGLHHGLTPIHMELINKLGNTPLLPVLAMAGAGQVGASLAVYLRTKDKELREIIMAALPVGMLGIGEPLIYGVTLPLGKPFIAACIGGAVGGAFIATTRIGCIAVGVSGIPLAFLATSPGLYLAGLVISYVAGFTAALIIGFDDRLASEIKPAAGSVK
ncbi:MAG: PTS transporter subunit EIIC [Firmicutes bacterium]|nr:PTS transporter subunit EIIC [Bacillota bacterium]